MSLDERQGLAGSIAGFDPIIVGPEGTALESFPSTKITFSELYAELLRIKSDLDPRRIHELNALIREHLQNQNNPHRITLSDITYDLIKEVFELFLPGMAPCCAPTYSVVPEFSQYLTLMTSVMMNMSYIDSYGKLSRLNNTLSVDYGEEIPSVNLFGARTNYFLNSSATGSHVAAINATSTVGIYNQPSNDLYFLSHPTATFSETNSFGKHGVSIDIGRNVNDYFTTSFFLKPHRTDGYLVITSESDTTLAIFDIANMERVDTLATLTYKQTLSGGWMRFGITTVMNPLASVKVLFVTDLDNLTYQGVQGASLFSLYETQCELGIGMSPLMITNGSVVSRQDYTISNFSVTLPEEGTFVLKGTFYLPTSGTKVLLSQNGLNVITLTPNTVSIMIGTSANASTTVVPLTNKYVKDIAVSYNDTGVKVKTVGVPVVNSTETHALDQGNMYLHSTGGYLKEFSIYPEKFGDDILNYLTADLVVS